MCIIYYIVLVYSDQTADSESDKLHYLHPNEPDIVKNGRVKGRLIPSRGIGDGIFKHVVFNDSLPTDLRLSTPLSHPYTTAKPEVRVFRLIPEDRFLVVATDGLWDVLSNQQVVDIVLKVPPGENAATALIEEALAASCPVGQHEKLDKTMRISSLLTMKERYKRYVFDDTTVFVIYFDNTTVQKGTTPYLTPINLRKSGLVPPQKYSVNETHEQITKEYKVFVDRYYSSSTD